jgi:tetratricopeptide (TPR) repeat protein
MSDAVQVGKDLDLKEQIAWGLDHLASTYAFMTRFDEAEKIAQEGWTLAVEIGNREYQSGVLTTRAILEWRKGNLDVAIEAGERGAEIAEMIGLAHGVVIGKWAVGWLHWQRGEYQDALKALEYARASAQPYTEFMPFLSVMTEAELGSVMIDAGADKETALALHKHALALSESPVGGMANGVAWADIGWCAVNLGNLDLAQKLFTRALEHPSFFRVVMKPRNWLGLAQLARERGEFDAAQNYIAQAREMADTAAMKPYQAMTALAAGQLELARGNYERALEFFNDAETRAMTIRLRPTILDARVGAAQSLHALGRADQANEKRAHAQAMRDEIADLFSDDGARNAYLQNG